LSRPSASWWSWSWQLCLGGANSGIVVEWVVGSF
jgi:hypothetical protein